MKKCLQCEQVYGDETNFCLSDGSTLVSVSGAFASPGETPTVFSGAPAPTNFNNPPFIAPVSTAAQAEPAKSNTVLIALAVGVAALLIGGAVVGLAMYGIFYAGKNEPNAAVNNSNAVGKSNQNTSGGQKTDNETQAQNLKQQQEKLDKDKQKLEDERKALEAKKKQDAQKTPPPSSASVATIIDPPSNIRAKPNGAVLCVAEVRGTVLNILGPTGVSDDNGTWYYTDFCGKRGVIHSSQIRF